MENVLIGSIFVLSTLSPLSPPAPPAPLSPPAPPSPPTPPTPLVSECERKCLDLYATDLRTCSKLVADDQQYQLCLRVAKDLRDECVGKCAVSRQMSCDVMSE